jgi:putative addiction module component (TIGR02574 family)
MTLTIEQIRKAALQLDRTQREALAEELWESISEADREAIDAAWLAELDRRCAAFDRGETTESDVDTVIARIKSRRRS